MGFLASLLAIVYAPPSFWAWLYPLPLLLVLALSLLGSWLLFLAWARRQMRSALPSVTEQERLDRLFAVLPRNLVRTIDSQDFYAPWPSWIAAPLETFVREFDEVEEHFDTPTLEERRRELHLAANELRWADAMNGFPHSNRDGTRNVGFTLGEMENFAVLASSDPRMKELNELVETRAETIRSAADRFVTAHTELVREAKALGYSLDELRSGSQISLSIPGAREEVANGTSRAEQD